MPYTPGLADYLSRSASSSSSPMNRVDARPDPGTRSNYDAWKVEHTSTSFTINFDKKRLEGSVALRLKRVAGAPQVVLDANYLDIQGVKVNGADNPKFEVDEPKVPIGGALTVHLSEEAAKGESVEVEIKANTTEKCTALQWFTPEQTSNKKHPYMFSQCQPNHARSIFPCQDTPAVKSTFDNTFKSQLPVLNSALDSESGDGVYRFKQPVPIPSYLYAVASGDIARAAIGKTSQVATSPDMLEACKWEFEHDMDKFIAAVEKNILPKVPYAWGTYNVLVVPPSFPFGGMENPIWTYVTPTVISADRENVDVIAHELSHSWSGNLVTSMSWEHFWLNEGWTTYLERRIQEVIHGTPHFHFSSIIGWKALTDAIQNFGESHPFTQLVVDLKGVDPDDAFSTIPYEKGFTFLFYLDNLVGREKWDAFANAYFQKFARQSLDSFQFKDSLLEFFTNDKETSKKLASVDWDTWFFKPGFPPKPDFDTSMADICYSLADKWAARATGQDASFKPSSDDIKGWTANQVVVFLERVQLFPQPISAADSQLLGSTYGLSASKNVEVVARYFQIALKAQDKTQYGPATDLLGRVGRMKFVRPLYRTLNKVDRDLAVQTFEKNKAFYHPICRNMVNTDLYGQSSK